MMHGRLSPMAQYSKMIGRYGGPEFVASGTWAPGPANGAQVVRLQSRINLNRPLAFLMIVLRFRLVIANNNAVAVTAEAPQNILQRVRLTGIHTKRGGLTPVDLQGATAYIKPQLFGWRAPSRFIGNATYTLVAQPTVPFSMPLATFGNIGTYDVEVHYPISFAPWLGLASRAQRTAAYWLKPEDWGDSLQLELTLGDGSSVMRAANYAADQTFTAYGGATGSPTWYVYTVFAGMGRDLASKIPSMILMQNEQVQVGGTLAAIANRVRLYDLLHEDTLNLILKSGVNHTVTPTAGVQSFLTLNDSTFDNYVLVSDNKNLRNALNNFAAKEYAAMAFGTVQPGGYIPLTFVDSHTPATRLELSKIPSATQVALFGDITAASANTALSVTQEYVLQGN